MIARRYERRGKQRKQGKPYNQKLRRYHTAAQPASQIGFINLDAKLAGKPGAGNPHAGFAAAGTGNRAR